MALIKSATLPLRLGLDQLLSNRRRCAFFRNASTAKEAQCAPMGTAGFALGMMNHIPVVSRYTA